MSNIPEENKVKKPTGTGQLQEKERKHIKKEGRSIYEILAEDINNNLHMSEDERVTKLAELERARETKVNILLVGPTGVGKSSTINALFDMNVATVGEGVDPETDSLLVVHPMKRKDVSIRLSRNRLLERHTLFYQRLSEVDHG